MSNPGWFRVAADFLNQHCPNCGWSGDVEGVLDGWDRQHPIQVWWCPLCHSEHEQRVKVADREEDR